MNGQQVKFFYNGIKVNGVLNKGDLVLSHDKDGNEHVTWYAREYGSHPDLYSLFLVRNESDYYTDYIDKDYLRITPESEYYEAAKRAALQRELRNARYELKNRDKRGSYERYAGIYSREKDLAEIKRLEELVA